MPVNFIITVNISHGFNKNFINGNQDKEIKAINELLKVSHRKKLPVYFTIVSYCNQNLADAGIWYLKQKGLDTLRDGSKAVEIDPRIERFPEDILITKKYASVFFGTNFISLLNSRNIDTLVIVGCTTSGCVRATAVDAVQFGYRPIIIREAVADRLKEAHEQSLADLQLKYADVKSLGEVIKYLEMKK